MPFYTTREQIVRLIGTLEDIGKDEEASEDFIKHDHKEAIFVLKQALRNGVESDAAQKITA
jgi:hypothetical protein